MLYESIRSSRSSRRGVMLLIVTLVLTALTLSGAALLTLMKTEREASTTRGRESLVKSVDRSAVVFIIGTLEESREEQTKIGGLYNNPNYFCAAPLLTTDDGGDDSSWFTIVSPKFTDTKIEGVRYGLTDESTRLNLEAVLAWDAESPGAGRTALMKLPGMTTTAADSILDWIDPDEKPRASGAEAKYYEDKDLPYSPRNAVPVFLEELLLARGVTRAQLYGADENFTYGVDKIDESLYSSLGGSLTEIPSGTKEKEGEASVPWKELVTVFSAEKDVDPKGDARVDLNGDDLQFLYSEASERVGEELAKFIVLYRQYGPEQKEEEDASSASNRRRRRSGYASAPTSTEETSELTVAQLSSAALDLSLAPTTPLKTPLDLVGARVVVGSVVYESPIDATLSKDNMDQLFNLLDYCSTSKSTTIVGRVNINAAPRAVLSAIPGLETADIQKIIDERPAPEQELPSEYRHASWLYSKGIVTLDQMKSLYSKVTSRGDAYRGQVIGFLDDSNEMSRAEVVVDGTTEPPRQVFYKDLTTFGKGFNDSVLYGGGVTKQAQTAVGGSEEDWRAVDQQQQLFEIVDDRGSAYTRDSSADNAANADPFASVELATGVSTVMPESPPTPSPTVDSIVLAPASQDASVSSTSSSVDASTDANSTDSSDDSTSDASSETETDSDESATTEEPTRREKLLDALRSAREARQSRYEQ